MKKKIAVDESLFNVKKKLSEEGYDVVNAMNYEMADALVVTGMDNNMMNMQETDTKAPVIDASGKTTNEIYSEIKSKVEI